MVWAKRAMRWTDAGNRRRVQTAGALLAGDDRRHEFAAAASTVPVVGVSHSVG